MIVRFEQVNARGEGSRPRVDLIALGALLDRAALGVEMLRLRLRAAGEVPARPPLTWKKTSLLRFGKSGRSGPARSAAPHAPGDETCPDRRRATTTARGIPLIPFQELSAPGTDLSQVTDEDLIDELHNRGFLVAKADRGKARAGRSPGDRSHLHRSPRAGTGAARLGVFPARWTRRLRTATAAIGPAGRPGRRRGWTQLTRR